MAGGLGTLYQRQSLDWMFGGSAPTSPTTRALGISFGVPTSVSMSEVATGSGITRQTVTFASAAVTNAGSAYVTNANTVSFGPVSAGCTISGCYIVDNLVTASGSIMAWGSLATARTLGAGDSLLFNPGNLTCTLTVVAGAICVFASHFAQFIGAMT